AQRNKRGAIVLETGKVQRRPAARWMITATVALRRKALSPSQISDFQTNSVRVAVGTTIAGRPPHRSVLAALPHTAPTLDELRRNVAWDRDARHGVLESSGQRSVSLEPKAAPPSGCGDREPCATVDADADQRHGVDPDFPGSRGIGSNRRQPS